MTTAAEAWEALEQMFASRSKARIVQLRVQLATVQKGDLSMAEYFHRMKNLADTMASIGHPLGVPEFVSYVLAGLGNSYDALVTSLTSRSDDLNIGELYAHLVSYEARNPTANQFFPHSANNAMRGDPFHPADGHNWLGDAGNPDAGQCWKSSGRILPRSPAMI